MVLDLPRAKFVAWGWKQAEGGYQAGFMSATHDFGDVGPLAPGQQETLQGWPGDGAWGRSGMQLHHWPVPPIP